MKRILQNFCHPAFKNGLVRLSKTAFISFILSLSLTNLFAQWDGFATTGPGIGNPGGPGYTNWGSGVVTLTDTTSNSGTCQASVIHETSTTYSSSSASNFSQCYRVFFGCPGNDQIGSDANGDGMAFSFWSSSTTWNEQNGLACGGGLGYMGAMGNPPSPTTKMITVEFDTYGSVCGSNFDCIYGGNVAPSTNDEISIHFDGDASETGLLAGSSVNAGNLEDGLVHTVCITYNPTTRFMTVTIDGVTRLNMDLGATYNLATYFGAGVNLNQSWSAGKYGANNFQTVGPAGSNLVGTIGHGFCPGFLPVSLISFTGELIDESVFLNWSTSSETNNQKFIIERSTNLPEWEAIGEVEGAGNSSSILNYSFTNYSPLASVVYYRLRQVNIDGTESYSNVVSLKRTKEVVSLTPSPLEDFLTINSNLDEAMNITIRDVLGNIMYQGVQKTENGTLTIHPDLSPGAYMITLQTESFLEQRKIIKK